MPSKAATGGGGAGDHPRAVSARAAPATTRPASPPGSGLSLADKMGRWRVSSPSAPSFTGSADPFGLPPRCMGIVNSLIATGTDFSGYAGTGGGRALQPVPVSDESLAETASLSSAASRACGRHGLRLDVVDAVLAERGTTWPPCRACYPALRRRWPCRRGAKPSPPAPLRHITRTLDATLAFEPGGLA